MIPPSDCPQGVILDRVDPAYYLAMKATAEAEREAARRILKGDRND
jgi:hypothetical protein